MRASSFVAQSDNSDAATTAMQQRTTSAIILAAGKGTRMKSDLPKVAHQVAGRSMVEWVADACVEAGCSRIVVVVGYQQGVIRRIFDGWSNPRCTLEFAEQTEQLGTGHAVRCAEALFAHEKRSPGNDVFVLAGDGPLIRPETLAALLERHRSTGASAALATSVIADSTGYGRIVRDPSGRFVGIVEQKNATPDQLTIREVNPSYYCFDAKDVFAALDKVTRDAVSGEFYITDVPALLMKSGRRVEVIDAVPPEDVLSINTPEQLAEVDRILRTRHARTAAHAGRGRP
ncbi:MAG: NTP transferase domain-containing protein [Phycisphaerae bacterium]|nr:NTP transferase domain-containing protein [Phycisphaerae bacterium]